MEMEFKKINIPYVNLTLVKIRLYEISDKLCSVWACKADRRV